MIPYFSAVALFILTSVALASPLSDKAKSFSPDSNVVAETTKEVKLETPHRSIIEIEFHRDGALEEASGNQVDKDKFNPSNGLLTLSDALKKVRTEGKNPMGEWSLEESTFSGHHYEFEGFENGVKMDYRVDAKSGAVNSKKDD